MSGIPRKSRSSRPDSPISQSPPGESVASPSQLGLPPPEILELRTSISAKTTELTTLIESISSLSISLTSTDTSYDVCSSIFTSLQNAPQILSPPSPSADDDSHALSPDLIKNDPFLQAHKLKLDGKRRELLNLSSELGSDFPAPELSTPPATSDSPPDPTSVRQSTLFGRQQALLQQFAALKREEAQLLIGIEEAKICQRAQALTSDQFARESNFLRGRINQATSDLRDLGRLERDARCALANLEGREIEYAEHFERHSELSKDIASREAILIQLEVEMAPIRRRVSESQQFLEREVADIKDIVRERQRFANWEEERKNLQTALRETQKQMRALMKERSEEERAERERGGKGGETIAEVDLDTLKKFEWLVRKWGGDARLKEVSEQEGPLEGLWESINGPRLELCRMIAANDKKVARLAKINDHIRRNVERYQGKVEKQPKEGGKQVKRTITTEEELRQKIRIARIRLEQCRIDHKRD